MSSYAHNTGTFIGKGGTEIFFQNWCVDNPKGVIVITHGLGEHSGRYDNIINTLKGNRISIYALDHRGHGRSGGKRGRVDSFMDYVYDLKLFIDLIKEENSTVPLILLGHSMGGAIACKYSITYSEDLDGLILSSPAFIFGGTAPKWKKKIGIFLSKYLPGLAMPTGLPTKDLSHDPYVIEAYENDRLVHDLMSTRLYTEFAKNGEECISRGAELRIPLLIFHGRDDRIVDYRGSEQLFNNASSREKELRIYDGFYHETMNEIENKKVLQMITQWITKLFGRKKLRKHAKKKTPKKPIKKITKSSAAKAAHKKFKKAPPKRGAKKLK